LGAQVPPDIFLQPDVVFDNGRLLSDAVLYVTGGRVRVIDTLPNGAKAQKITGLVSPGLIDLQVNGGGGVLFNTSPTPEGIAAILDAHRIFGTTALLPTVITDAPEVTEAAAEAVLSTWGKPGLLGIHIEGPHINTTKRGTHSARFIRPLDARTIRLAQRLRNAEIPVLLTLAPEAATVDGIAELTSMGVIVSLGHSNATAAETEAALAGGARNFTHLFNAMSPMEGRAPGMVGAAILSRADIGIICDGVHVSDEMVRLAIDAHGVERMHLVSDAMPTVGGAPAFMLYGSEIRVEFGPDGARLVNAQGSLAGAHTTMADSMLRLVGKVLLSMEQALKMAITNPARIIGAEDLGRIDGQAPQELLWWEGSNPPRSLTSGLALDWSVFAP
jgi:N-acetylglucosamine-6-phosphate deacetylase